MSLIYQLGKILEESKTEYENYVDNGFCLDEVFLMEGNEHNVLAKGDNLSFIKHLINDKGYKGKFQLIYIDPPFFSQADYKFNINLESGKEKLKLKGKAYKDTWDKGMSEYLKMLAIRFYGIHDLLSDEGCLWVHLDWHSVHYVKIILDEIFGENNFINEIIWQYKSGGTSKRHFSRKHDTLLFYGKGKKYFFKPQQEKSYNRGLKPYGFKGVEEFKDEIGWHTLVNMKDVWQIDMVGRTSKERCGYATQKPEAIIERILESCTSPGDLCGDFFSGSGTLPSVANKMNRKWICCDKGEMAIVHTTSRLLKNNIGFKYYKENLYDEYNSKDDKIIIKSNIYKDKNNVEYIQIELLDFYSDLISNNEMNKNNINEINRISFENPLILVEYWSIDFDFDGYIHKPKDVIFKNGNSLKKSSKNPYNESNVINVRIVDYLGRRYEKTLKNWR